jgi:predicted metal-binding membrane protein
MSSVPEAYRVRRTIDAQARARDYVVSGLALAGLAWMLLAVGAATPWWRFLRHDGTWDALCGSGLLLPAALYVGGWVLMLAAMVLPTALPVLSLLARMTAWQADGRRLAMLAAAGDLAAWAGFGLAARPPIERWRHGLSDASA